VDLQAFISTRAGRPRDSGRGYFAFVPNALPPDIQYGSELVRTLSAADRAVGRLAGTGALLPNPYLLIRPFVAREAVLSSRIEGTQASLADLFAFEAAPDQQPDVEDVREVANYTRALRYGLDPGRALPMSLRLLRDLHAILKEGVRGSILTPGEFRRTQNWIGPAGCTLREATIVPPDVPQMHEALADLERYLHADDPAPPLVRLAVLHYQFEAIHPFLDGNGRIGRLLVSLLLCEWGLLGAPLLYLSAYFERHRAEYYARLLATSQRGEWEQWVIYFLAGVASQAEDAASRAARLRDLREEYQRRVRQTHSSTGLLTLVDELFGLPVLTIQRASEVLGLTYQGALWNVRQLVSLSILTAPQHRRRPHLYVAQDILRAIGDDVSAAGTDSTRGTHPIT